MHALAPEVGFGGKRIVRSATQRQIVRRLAAAHERARAGGAAREIEFPDSGSRIHRHRCTVRHPGPRPGGAPQPIRAGASRVHASCRLINRAVASYLTVYQSNPGSFLWHGINAVACAMRAARDGIALETAIDPVSIARDILTTISSKPEDGAFYWDLATAAEASLALGKRDEALEWIRRYVAKPVTETDAFEVARNLQRASSTPPW